MKKITFMVLTCVAFGNLACAQARRSEDQGKSCSKASDCLELCSGKCLADGGVGTLACTSSEYANALCAQCDLLPDGGLKIHSVACE